MFKYLLNHFSKTISNEWGCFWGSGNNQTPEVSPLPNPSPIPSASDTAPAETADARRRKLAAMRYGMMSTVKTSQRGITGNAPDLSTPAATGAKATLGA